MHLHKLLGEPSFRFRVYMSSQLEKVWVLTCWNLRRQKMQKLSAVEKTSRQLQRVREGKLLQNSVVVLAESRTEQYAARSLRKRGRQAESIQQNLQNRPVVFGEKLFKLFSLVNSSTFLYQTLTAFPESLGGKIPLVDDVLSSHEQDLYPTTSLNQNCTRVEI